MRVLDSHLHLWDPAVLEYAWLSDDLRARFDTPELAAAVDDAPPAAARAFVFVQAECAHAQALAEVDWVLARAEAAGIVGIVARAAVERGEDVVGELEALRTRPRVVGVRRVLQDEAPGFATSPAVRDGLRAVAAAGLVFDACVRAGGLREVIALADAVPELPLILDHLGKPPGARADPKWTEDLRELARRPHVIAKVSGLPAEARPQWTADDVRAALDVARDAFGPERLMFGSDWPVSVPYSRWLRAVLAWTADWSGAERDDLLWGNAARAYGMA
ncbi:amidohydrolase family protein [Microbacterium sp. ABRD28]|uniref:amidohydrolase family protein n=1 Tax=Microbacterium sp. ABRD28 TaxID=2268461 RepID=UPI000F54CFA8|nr:amidohydrolase family protein [Microbacterium sp. ABRD28]AZC12642.1 hypothetical protein DT073_01990 [Microbacterium sp. ABRD28]